jgi:hypothetical protein
MSAAARALPRRRGRPRRVEGEVASERIWGWVTPTERAALLWVATENGLEISQIIRDAVNEYVADYSDKRVFSVTVNSHA